MDAAIAIPLASVIVAMSTLLMTAASMRNSTHAGDAHDLRERLAQCEERCRTLSDENIDLMRRVIQG